MQAGLSNFEPVVTKNDTFRQSDWTENRELCQKTSFIFRRLVLLKNIVLLREWPESIRLAADHLYLLEEIRFTGCYRGVCEGVVEAMLCRFISVAWMLHS